MERKPRRLREYNYATPSAYFVTICSQNELRLFGEILNAQIKRNDAGEMILDVYAELEKRFQNVKLDTIIVMPDHVHFIIFILPDKKAVKLGDLVGAFKSITTLKYIYGVKENGWERFEKKLWQANYYDHVIRSESDLFRIRKYIEENPLRWSVDPKHQG